MRNNSLFYALTGLDPNDKYFRPTVELNPETHNFGILEKGHVMEYILVKPDNKRIVTLFFGPKETVVQCHPSLSTMVSLDSVKIGNFTYGGIIGTLHQFPESRLIYRELRDRYNKKVADRLQSMQTMTPRERFRHLHANQPWVLALAGKEDIASYLGISVGMLRKML